MPIWRDDEIAILRDLYPMNTANTLSGILDRPTWSIYNKAALLALKKSPAFYESGAGGRLDGIKGSATRFTAGTVPWNKGTHFIAGGRAPETQFKKGSAPHNTLPIGALRITKDGTLQLKVSDKKGSPSNRWRGVHELVWMAAHGPIPAGHICVFKPGQKTAALDEITADKVECISFRENMARNTVHNLPKPIALAVQLRGALVRQINRATKASTS